MPKEIRTKIKIKSRKNTISHKEKFLELALVGVLWILVWIPMTYFVVEYGGRIISDAEYELVAQMALRPSGESPVSTEEEVLVNQMASAPLE